MIFQYLKSLYTKVYDQIPRGYARMQTLKRAQMLRNHLMVELECHPRNTAIAQNREMSLQSYRSRDERVARRFRLCHPAMTAMHLP